VSPGYRAFLLGTATDQPTRAFVLAPNRNKGNTEAMVAMLRRSKARRKIISSTSR